MSGIFECFKKQSKRAIKCILPSKLASKFIVPVSLGIPVTEARLDIILGAGKGDETGDMDRAVKSLKKSLLAFAFATLNSGGGSAHGETIDSGSVTMPSPDTPAFLAEAITLTTNP